MMSGRINNEEHRVIDLLDLACDGRLAPEGVDELHRLLERDFLYFQVCVQYLDLHSELIRFAVEPLTCEELCGTLAREPHDAGRRRFRMMVWGMVASLAIGCVTAVGLTSVLRSIDLPAAPQQIVHAAPIVEPQPVVLPLAKLAEISRGTGWHGNVRAVGQGLFHHDRIELSQGRILLEFPSGVQVRFQGPGVLELESALAVRMFGGRALANVPAAGSGFTIRSGNAVVVDYGTEFLVDASVDQQAAVAVRQGKIGIGFDSTVDGGERMSLTTGGAVHVNGKTQLLARAEFNPELFEPFDLDRARIAGLSGALRYVLEPQPTFPLKYVTPVKTAHLLREVSQYELPQALSVSEPFGDFQVHAGTAVDSFLIHYSPDDRPKSRIQGNVTFEHPVLAVIGGSEMLGVTDKLLGVAPDRENDKSRGLDNATDKIEISADRRTVTFAIQTTQNYTDQIRILVQSPPAVLSAGAAR